MKQVNEKIECVLYELRAAPTRNCINIIKSLYGVSVVYADLFILDTINSIILNKLGSIHK
jgi:hypothetical protein